MAPIDDHSTIGQLSKKQQRLFNAAVAIQEDSALETNSLGFMARAMALATMPHKKTNELRFRRTNGNFSLSLVAVDERIGLPYGSMPRLLVSWMTTEAVKTQQQKLELGHSLAEFMEKLDLIPTGGRWGSIDRLKNQVERLFTCIIVCRYGDDAKTFGRNFTYMDEYHWWNKQAHPNQLAFEPSTITLSKPFFDEITQHPVPIDTRALQALKQSPLALDTYAWLTYRYSYLRKSTLVPWKGLRGQFGAEYADDKQGRHAFKRAFKKHLKNVLAVYPQALVEEDDDGLWLKPSPTHVGRSSSTNVIIDLDSSK